MKKRIPNPRYNKANLKERLRPEEIKNLMSRLDPEVYEGWLKRQNDALKLKLKQEMLLRNPPKLVDPEEAEVEKLMDFVRSGSCDD